MTMLLWLDAWKRQCVIATDEFAKWVQDMAQSLIGKDSN